MKNFRSSPALSWIHQALTGPALRKAIINLTGIGLLLLGAQWFAGWVQPALKPSDLFTPPVVGPQAVKAVFVQQETLERTATYTGVVHPDERVVVRARTDGFVEAIRVYPGDRIAAGDLLVQLETSELEPKLAAALANANYLKAELRRDESLFKDGGISRAQLDLSRKSSAAADAAVELIETEIGYARVRAPSDGWVSKRAVDPGQYVRKGDHLLAYDRLAQVRIRFDVALRDLNQVRPGTEIMLEFPGLPQAAFSGNEQPPGTEGPAPAEPSYRGAVLHAAVTAVFPAASEPARLGVVEVRLPNPNGLLKSNAYVIGHLVTGRVESAWTVPEQALTPMPGGKTVIFLAPAFADQGAAEMREVKVGQRNGRKAQILEGLNEPAFVVVRGNRSLTAGETVMVIAREGGF